MKSEDLLPLGSASAAPEPAPAKAKPPRFVPSYGEFGRHADLDRAKAEAVRHKREAEAARDSAAKLQERFEKERRTTKTRLWVIAVLMMTAALVKLVWLSPSAEPQREVAPSAAETRRALAKGTEAEKALDRLSDAFNSIPDMDQTEIVREINAKGPPGSMPCPLAWNQGMPSIYVGDKSGKTPPSMAVALNQCASEVEKLRIEKNRAEGQ